VTLYFRALLIAGTLCIGACTSMISAAKKEPIQEPPTRRTLGSMVEDQAIETKAGVNLRKVDPELAESRITVVSYNGIVLLVGQVPSARVKTLAERTVAELREVRRVHNALEVSGKPTLVVRSSDTWITTKVKSRLLADSEVMGGRIKVVTDSGTVYLMGLILRADSERAANIARRTNGVQRVVKVFEYID